MHEAQRPGLRHLGPVLVVSEVHQREPGRVPDLVDELPIAGHPPFRERDVHPGRRHRGQREPERVGPDLVHHLERIDDVPLRLGHLLAALVAHESGDVDVAERDVAGELHAGHDHPRDPEEDDVERRQHQVRRVVSEDVVGPVRPAHRAERPQLGTEPGVEDVVVLLQCPAALALLRRLLGDDHPAAGLAVPRRDPVTPPELPGDAPVVDVVHPLVVGLRPVLGEEADLPFLHDADRLFGQRLDLHEPLRGHQRLDHRAAPLTRADRVLVVGDLDEQPLVLELLHDPGARLEPVEAGERPRRRR